MDDLSEVNLLGKRGVSGSFAGAERVVQSPAVHGAVKPADGADYESAFIWN